MVVVKDYIKSLETENGIRFAKKDPIFLDFEMFDLTT